MCVCVFVYACVPMCMCEFSIECSSFLRGSLHSKCNWWDIIRSTIESLIFILSTLLAAISNYMNYVTNHKFPNLFLFTRLWGKEEEDLSPWILSMLGTQPSFYPFCMHVHIINLPFQALFYLLFQKFFFSRYVEIVSVACNKKKKNSKFNSPVWYTIRFKKWYWLFIVVPDTQEK